MSQIGRRGEKIWPEQVISEGQTDGGRRDRQTDHYRTPQSGPKLTFKALYNQNMRAVQYKHNSSSAYVTAYFAVLLLIE